MVLISPVEKRSWSDRIHLSLSVFGMMDPSKLFLAASPTLHSLVSSGDFHRQKNEKFLFHTDSNSGSLVHL